jgi:hypothetical protein
MAEETISSALDIKHDCIVDGPVQPDPFIPRSANLLPKFPTHISKDSWELWEFDSFSADGELALGCSLYCDERGYQKGGFYVEANALWPDGRHRGKTLLLPSRQSVKRGMERSWDSGGIRWTVRTESEGARSVSSISVDCPAATLRFEVPGEL